MTSGMFLSLSVPLFLYLENGDKNTSVPGGFAGFGKGLKETMHVKSFAGVFYAVRAQYPVARSLLPTVFSVPVGEASQYLLPSLGKKNNSPGQ